MPSHTRLRSTRLTWLLATTAVTVFAVAIPAAGAASPVLVPAPPALAASPSTPFLPFDLPSPDVLRASPKKVFAHYLASLPISLDNQPPATDYYARNYLTPGGENGIHAAYGGYLRNRPLGRAPLAGSDWRLQDMKTEVRRAASAGLDGFTFDVLQVQNGSVPQLWDNANLMMQAAAAVDPGFKIMLMPDMSGSLGSKDVGTLAAGMAALAQYSSAYRLADGRLVISPFAAEVHDATWWSSFESTMQSTYGISVALLPVFVANEQNFLASFAPISFGMSNWGSRNPQYNSVVNSGPGSAEGRVAAARALGQKWMQPVAVQDERPNQSVFDEAANTQNLRLSWQIARDTNAEFVQLPTWNDYTEGTEISPSADDGWSLLDLNSYYLTWYKTGTAPPITRDTVYLTHRTQPWSAPPAFPQTQVMSLRGGTPARDTVEALTFLTAPANVLVTVGNSNYVCAVDTGVDTCTVPLGAGTVTATVLRAGVPRAAISSPRAATTTPYIQDLSYIASSSGRTPATPTTVALASATPVSRTLQAPTLDDTYANAGAPRTNYGTSASLSVRGTVGAISYLRFGVPTTPPGSALVSASLRLRSLDDSSAASTDNQLLSVVNAPWTETGLTWNGKPALGPLVATLPGPITPSTSYDVPIDPAVVAALATGSSLALSAVGPDESRFWSGDYGNVSMRPQLILTFAPVLPPSS